MCNFSHLYLNFIFILILSNHDSGNAMRKGIKIRSTGYLDMPANQLSYLYTYHLFITTI